MRIQLNIVNQDKPGEVRRFFGNPDEPYVYVLNGHSRKYVAVAEAPFSIKSMPRGQARYTVDGRSHHLAPGAALLVNGDQHYDMEFREGLASESFCLFFDAALVESAWGKAREFPNLVFRPDSAFARKLSELRANLLNANLSGARLEEHLLELLGAATQTADLHRGQARAIPARKAAVRAALLAKIDSARSRIEDDPARADLDAIAAASGLSKFHLVRLFRAVYGAPPMAYAKRIRMERAAELLKRTRKPVTDIAADLGYEHLSAFSKAFQAHSGVSPLAYRAAN
ncbi:MAG: AraC family transcriptional regulator [Alphaproteobacteria bacterium]